MNNQQIIDILNDTANSCFMNEWETKFISDVSSRYAKNKRLSPAQRAILDKTLNRINDVKNGNLVIDTNFIAEVNNLISDIGDSNQYYQKILPSFKQQLETGKILSENQLKIVEQAKTFVVQNTAHKIDWSEDKKEKFDIICKYYSGSPYFKRVVDLWKTQENYIPNSDDYEKMVNNKYSVKVLNNWYEQPKFSNGQVVRIADKFCSYACRDAKIPYQREDPNTVYCGFVVSSNSGTPAPRKGGKMYKVLMFGSNNPINVYESELRKHKI
jgi:hypothetical protein